MKKDYIVPVMHLIIPACKTSVLSGSPSPSIEVKDEEPTEYGAKPGKINWVEWDDFDDMDEEDAQKKATK